MTGKEKRKLALARLRQRKWRREHAKKKASYQRDYMVDYRAGVRRTEEQE